MRRSSGEPGARRKFSQIAKELGVSTNEAVRLSRQLWARVRSEYVTGEESLSQIADRLGITKSAVEKHSSPGHRDNKGIGWDAARQEFLRSKSESAEAHSLKSSAEVLADLRDKTAIVSMGALEKIQRRLDNPFDVIDTRDLIGIAKLTATLRVELAGDPNGAPVRIDHIFDGLTTDELRRLAAEPNACAHCESQSGSELPTEGGI
jgi:predicted transcriptional regulator